MLDEAVRGWVARAEEDWIAVMRLQVAGLRGTTNVVASLCQQCAEKYLKAVMQYDGTEPPLIHHLPRLLDEIARVRPELERLRDACEVLTAYAVAARYPGDTIDEAEAAEAIAHVGQVRGATRGELGLGAGDDGPGWPRSSQLA